MPAKKYTFRPPVCDQCGTELEGVIAPVGGWKGDIPMGYCPNAECGRPHQMQEVKNETKKDS